MTQSLPESPDQSNIRGDSVSVATVASDVDGECLNLQCHRLPAGVDIDPATGVISGTPTTVGTYNVTVTVTDPADRLLRRQHSFVWEIPQPSPCVYRSSDNTAQTINEAGIWTP
jgi:hypothetical protein